MGKGKNVKRKKRKEKRWEEINTSKVVEVKSLNLDLDILWKDLGMKLEEVIEDYKTLLFSKVFKKKMFYENYELLKTLCQI
jgi:polynucleotide 5'-kinase involved in rRNA processing